MQARTAPIALNVGFEFEAAQADPCDARRNLFHHVLSGDLLVTVPGGPDLSARFGWVPLLNVALQFASIDRRLADEHGFASLEFTESEDRLDFVRQGDRVRISSTYAAGDAVVPVAAVRAELLRFRAWARDEAVRRAPCVRRRPEFAAEFDDA